MVRRLEELSNNAWPALETLQYDGWILRFANGVTKRSNSVNLLYPSTIDPGEKIMYCEWLYESRGIPPCFKVTPAAEPKGIDRYLESLGYPVHSVISLQTLDISRFPDGPQANVHVETGTDLRWMDDFIRMNEFDPARKQTYLGIMDHLCLPKCLVTVSHEHQTTGVGLGVVENSHIGLFDIVVEKAFRNKGQGRLIVESILGWGKNQGARTAYLQVLSNNIPANRLYQKLGFKEAYRYWYRMKYYTATV